MGDLSKVNKITGSALNVGNRLEKRIVLGVYQTLIIVKPVEKSKFDIDSYYWTENTERKQLHKFVSVPSDFLLSTIKSIEQEIKNVIGEKNKSQIFNELEKNGFELKGKTNKKSFIEDYL